MSGAALLVGPWVLVTVYLRPVIVAAMIGASINDVVDVPVY